MSKRKPPVDDDDFSDADLPYKRIISDEAVLAAAAAKPPPSRDDKFSKKLHFRALPRLDTVLYSENITPANKKYLKDNFGVLYKTWGYRQGLGEKHTNYEALLHDEAKQCYSSCTPITDKLFRNLQQLCDRRSTLIQTDLTSSSGAELGELCDIDTVKQLMNGYLEEDGVEEAMFSLANYNFVPGGSNNGIMAVLCAAARGFLFLTVGNLGAFNAGAAKTRPGSANECLAYINALATFKPPTRRGNGRAGARTGGRKRSQSRSSAKSRKVMRSGSRRHCKKK
jgi:hypothetical protein